MPISSPSARRCSRIGRPFTCEPFIDSRSTRTQAASTAAGGLAQLGVDLEAAGPQLRIGHDLDAHRTHEDPALFTGRVACDLGQLALERGLHAAELLTVAGGEADPVVVGGDPLPTEAERRAHLHLATETAADLDRPEAGAEGAGERSLDEPFQAAFEVP